MVTWTRFPFTRSLKKPLLLRKTKDCHRWWSEMNGWSYHHLSLYALPLRHFVYLHEQSPLFHFLSYLLIQCNFQCVSEVPACEDTISHQFLICLKSLPEPLLSNGVTSWNPLGVSSSNNWAGHMGVSVNLWLGHSQ